MNDNAEDTITAKEITDDPAISHEIKRLHLKIDPNATVTISQDTLPPDTEVARQGSVLINLGRRKKYTIWGIVKTVGFIISTFVALTRLPESIDKASIYLANAHDYVCQTLSVHVQSPPPITWLTAPESHQYLVAKDTWLNDMHAYLETQERLIDISGSSSSSSSSSSSIYEAPSLSASTVPPEMKLELADGGGSILIPVSGLITQIRIDIDLNA